MSFKRTLYSALKGIIICRAIFSCKPDDSQVVFTKIPYSQTGINFSNPNIENETLTCLSMNISTTVGALDDINNDGLVDIYLLANQAAAEFFCNQQQFRSKLQTCK